MERISYTNKGTIPSGLPYSNINPCYTITREFEVPSGVDLDKYIRAELNAIKCYIDLQIERDFKEYTDFLKNRQCDHRFTEIEGKKYPHVTNIITPDKPLIPNLEEYALQGTALDEVAKIYTDLGILAYVQPEPTPNIKNNYEELFFGLCETLSNPKIKLENNGSFLVNDEFIYCGTPDHFGFYDGVSAIFDTKRSLNKKTIPTYLKQMASYVKCLSFDIDIMVLISPDGVVVDGNIDKWFNEFLLCRGAYKERFGV